MTVTTRPMETGDSTARFFVALLNRDTGKVTRSTLAVVTTEDEITVALAESGLGK